MKKLIPLLMALSLIGVACSQAESVDDVAGSVDEVVEPDTQQQLSEALSDLQAQAGDLVSEMQTSDQAAELQTTLDALSDDLSTVATAAAGGEVTTEDLQRLSSSATDFETDLSRLTGELDPDLQDQLETFRAEIQEMISQLMVSS